MKKILLLLTLFAFATPVQALARPGELDRSFSGNGRLVIPAAPPEADDNRLYRAVRLATALGPKGSLTLATSMSVSRLLPNGKPDAKFGPVPIEPPAGTRFVLAAVTVDSQGRALVAGTAESLTGSSEGPAGYPAPTAAQGIVYRFLPNGRPDPGFGSGGVISGHFGQEPPTGPAMAAGRFPYPPVPGEFPYQTRSVGIDGIAVDDQDRPVLMGTSISRVSTCGYSPPGLAYRNRTFSARLQTDGSLDQGFGAGGALTDPFVEDPKGPALRPTEGLVYISPGEEACPRIPSGEAQLLTFVTGGGQIERRVAVGAQLEDFIQEGAAVEVDRWGRVLVLLRKVAWGSGVRTGDEVVSRVTPNGALDGRFGGDGSVEPKLGAEVELLDLAVDRRGRTVLVGSGPGTVFAMRLNKVGKMDRSFGRGGRIVTSLAGKLETAQVSLDRRGRIVVSGTMRSGRLPSRYGIVIARYLGGDR